MTDSIFAKFILTIASIFTVLTGPSYIQVSENELNFNFKTGGNFPIYYFLNVQNVGGQKARFDVSSNVNWLFVYREGQSQQTNLVAIELPQNAPINFVLEIHPERLDDGISSAEISINAVQLQDYSVLDTKKIPVVLNKNLQITPPPIPTPSPSQIPTQTPLISSTTSPIPVLTISPTPKLISPSPASKVQKPGQTPTLLPTTPELSPILKPLKILIDSLKSLVRSLLRP